MKIAVPYENGQIFQHFGKTETFKVYTIENNEIVAAEEVNTNGTGHSALSQLLADAGVGVVIAGGIGDGAQEALTAAGIEICAGAQGDADAAVATYLLGELMDQGVTCDHHHHDGEEDECGCGCGDDCGCGCGGCHSAPQIEGQNVGKIVKVHYQGTFDDGTQFDSSYDRGEPIQFICGAGRMIYGFDVAVATMNVGETVNVHLAPEEAYGPRDERAIFQIPFENLPGSQELEVGQRVVLYDQMGRQTPVAVIAKDETTITMDANHEMAGKALNFKIELVEVQEH